MIKRTKEKRPVVLITGASTGIGLALGRMLVESNQYHVIMTARESSIPRFKKENIFQSTYTWLRPLDILSKRQRDILINEIDEILGGVDVLINNAGYMLSAVVEHVGEEERLKQMDTNFRAPMSLIRKVLPKMRQRKSGKIINISSVGGMMAMPTMAIYSASKFALEGATEALWYEVKPWNIKVTLIQPGFINSDGFQKTIQTKESFRAIGKPHTDYYYQYQEMGPFIAKLMKLSPSTSESVARRVKKVIEQNNPPLRVAGTIDAVFFYFIRRFLPRSFYHFMVWHMLPKQMRKPAFCVPKIVHKKYNGPADERQSEFSA